MRILIVCGVGVSSTFVAQRLQRAAAAAGIAVTARAGTCDDGVGSDDADLVLIGPHLAAHLDEMRSNTSLPVRMLSESCVRDRTGAEVLALVTQDAELRNHPQSNVPKGSS